MFRMHNAPCAATVLFSIYVQHSIRRSYSVQLLCSAYPMLHVHQQFCSAYINNTPCEAPILFSWYVQHAQCSMRRYCSIQHICMYNTPCVSYILFSRYVQHAQCSMCSSCSVQHRQHSMCSSYTVQLVCSACTMLHV